MTGRRRRGARGTGTGLWSAVAAVWGGTLLAAAVAPALAAQDSHLLVVSGLGGAPRYTERFHAWGETLVEAALQAGLERESVIWLAEDPSADPERIDGRSDRDGVEAALETLAQRAGAEDRIFVVLVGHGSSRGEESRINLPGRDLSASDFADLLEAFPSQEVVFVNTSSASGGFVPVLAGPRRTVVTATRSGREANEAVFGGHFARAFADEDADTDKDGRISVLEAFQYARTHVARAYDQDGRLLTEHALLEDDGDGEGSTEPAPGSDGAKAGRLFLAPDPGVRTAEGQEVADPVLQRLYREKDDLEDRIAELRALRDQMDPDRYESELESLLVDLALKTREIEAREGGG